MSSDSEDDASDGGEIPPHVSRIPDDEIDRAEALDARGGVFAATWRPCKGQPVAVALKAVDAVDLAEVFALRSFADECARPLRSSRRGAQRRGHGRRTPGRRARRNFMRESAAARRLTSGGA